MRYKIIIIGLDGASFEVLRPWIDAGRLPNLKAVMAEGVSGDLQSSVPPVTAPAWASFMTGKNPGKHGIFDFVVQDKNSYQFHPVNSRVRHGKTLWQVIGEQGGRVVLLNVPLTHPPEPVNGVLISDYLLATGRGEMSYPPELVAEIEQEFGPYQADMVTPYFKVTQADDDVARFVREYTQALTYKFRVAHCLLDKFDPDFLMLHLYGNDQICHWLWHLIDKTHPEHHPQQAVKHAATILSYYQAFDEQIGKLLQRIDEDTALLVLSDHGFGPVYKAIDLNTWLYREGYLVLRDRPLTKLRRWGWEAGLVPDSLMGQRWMTKSLATFAKRWPKNSSRGGIDRVKWAHKLSQLLLSFNDIDWSRTRAFSPFGFGQIRINVQGKWAHGCVAPGDEYHGIKREIVGKLRALTDPETGEIVDGKVVTKDEVYRGPFFDDAPDIFFLPINGKYRPKSMGFTSNEVISHFWGMTGIHKMKGILLALGTPFNGGVHIDGAQITDLFATILYLMGMTIPEDVDGKVLHQLFTTEHLQHHPIRFTDAPQDGEDQPLEAGAPDDEQEVIERLRDLGYLD